MQSDFLYRVYECALC